MKKIGKNNHQVVITPKNPPKKQEIKSLLRQNEFWIGLVIVLIFLLVGTGFVYSNISSKTSLQAKNPTPTEAPKPTGSVLSIPGIKKLANTSSGILGVFTKKLFTPTPAPTIVPSSPHASSSQPSSSSHQSSSSSSSSTTQSTSQGTPTTSQSNPTNSQPTITTAPTIIEEEPSIVPTNTPVVEEPPLEEQPSIPIPTIEEQPEEPHQDPEQNEERREERQEEHREEHQNENPSENSQEQSAE